MKHLSWGNEYFQEGEWLKIRTNVTGFQLLPSQQITMTTIWSTKSKSFFISIITFQENLEVQNLFYEISLILSWSEPLLADTLKHGDINAGKGENINQG